MAAVENEHGYIAHGSFDGPELAPYPPYVQTASDTKRWDAAYGIAEGLSRQFEPDGEPDPVWVWNTTRALYHDRSIPTGDRAAETVEEAWSPELEEGRERWGTGPLWVPGPADDSDDALYERSIELLAQLESRVPSNPADRQQMDHYLAALNDYFEGLLGHPDQWIPPEYDYEHELAAALDVDEAVLPHVVPTFSKKPYNATLHPRQRTGKWAEKFGAAKHVLANHAAHVEQHLGAHVAAARLAVDVRRQKPGADYHPIAKERRLRQDARRIAQREGKPVAQVHDEITKAVVTAHAREGSNRQGLRGRRQQAVRAAQHGIVRAQTHIANAILAENPVHKRVERSAEKHGGKLGRKQAAVLALADTAFPDPRDSAKQPLSPNASHPSQDAMDDLERGQEVVKRSLDAARWVNDNRDVLKGVGKVAHAVARAKGLTHAEMDEELEEAAAMSGAMIALYPDATTARTLSKHAGDGAEDPAQMHVTLKYLAEDHTAMGDELKAKLHGAVKAFASGQPPLEATTGKVDTFKGDEREYPVIAHVDADGIQDFRRRLVAGLPDGVMDDTYSSFKPHVTLKYVEAGEKHDVGQLEPTPLRFDKVHLVLGGKKTAYPLGG